MRTTSFLIPTLKETPAEAVIASHRLMMRAGLIRKISAGVYAWLPLGLRARRRVEQVVREEMDRAGAQEYLLPLMVPRELWDETGRYDIMGHLMMKVPDRSGKEFVLAPTHEEGFTHLLRSELQSYKQLPVTVYQIADKFRDELRPRFGVMRGRQFMMKDAYSFDLDSDGMKQSYDRMRTAYERAFKRLGLDTVKVKADSGAMGGSGSQEFMVPSEVGEDEIIVCSGCGYAANSETAVCREESGDSSADSVPACSETATPQVRTIEELCEFFSVPAERFIKTLVYTWRAAEQTHRAVVCIRGDLDVNQVKLANTLGVSEVELADEATVEQLTGAPLGFAGPVGLTECRVIADNSVKTVTDGITGANRVDHHLLNVVPGRDFAVEQYADLRTVKAGDRCADCGSELESFRGIEVGHIFQLGDKYTAGMNLTVLDPNGKAVHPLMGCYGIGIDRTLASVIEQHHDENGICWPAAVAPFQVHIVPLNVKKPDLLQTAEQLYGQLWQIGIETLLDDRDARAGFKFKDADLIGIPLRITVGEKGLQAGKVEWKNRLTGESGETAVADAVEFVKNAVDALNKTTAIQ